MPVPERSRENDAADKTSFADEVKKDVQRFRELLAGVNIACESTRDSLMHLLDGLSAKADQAQEPEPCLAGR